MAGKLILLAALVALLHVKSSTAATYTVGDALGWAVPPTRETYPNWAAPITFSVGDILVFNFSAGAHDVATVTNEAYESCNTNSPITMQTISPVIFPLNNTGEFNFICTFGTHCSLGQKFSINVTSAAPSPTSPPPSATPTAPAPSPVPASPSPSASSPPPMQAPGVSPPAQSPTSPPPGAVTPPGSSPPPPSTTTPTPPNVVSSPPPPSSATRSLTVMGFMGTLLAIAMGLTL